jgi:hypothetical protein
MMRPSWKRCRRPHGSAWPPVRTSSTFGWASLGGLQEAPCRLLPRGWGTCGDVLSRALDGLGFDHATSGDEVFRQLVLARIIESDSRLDFLRVLEEAGIALVSYATLNRRRPCSRTMAGRAVRGVRGPRRAGSGEPGALRRARALFRGRLGTGSVSPGLFKERRLDPQIIIGLATNQADSR